MYRQAAEVIDSVKPYLEIRFFLDKAQHLAAVIDAVKPHLEMRFYLDKAKHLAAIYQLPRDCWEAACDWLQKQESVTVVDVRKRVDAVVDCRQCKKTQRRGQRR